MQKYLQSLEFDKILARACHFVTCPQAQTMLEQQLPGENAEQVRMMLSQTDAIATLLIKNGSARISKVENVEKIVRRACKGGVLSMGELLEVACTLRNFRELVQWYGLTDHENCLLYTSKHA